MIEFFATSLLTRGRRERSQLQNVHDLMDYSKRQQTQPKQFAMHRPGSEAGSPENDEIK